MVVAGRWTGEGGTLGAKWMGRGLRNGACGTGNARSVQRRQQKRRYEDGVVAGGCRVKQMWFTEEEVEALEVWRCL